MVLSVLAFAGPAARCQAVDTDPLNRNPEVREAFNHFYSLDYEGAIARFRHIQAEHASDPIATAYLLDATLFQELYRQDLLDTTFYANDGFLTGKHTVSEDPKVRDEIKSLADRAVGLANDQLKNNPNDTNALFARGWSRSLEATYMAMVERSFGAALHLALGARSDHQRVLQLDPNYVDAKMVVGVYSYVVGALPFAFKLLVGFAGIHGSKSEGMALLQDVGQRGILTKMEAETSMMLFYRREAKYPKAVAIAHGLAAEYPRDYLFLLEEANLEKDSGQGEQAIASYQRILELSHKPGYFYTAHLELAYFGLGESLRGQKKYQEAVEAYREGAYQPTTSTELKRRCLLAAGESYDLLHDHNMADKQYQEVLAAGADTVQGNDARRYMKTAYSGH